MSANIAAAEIAEAALAELDGASRAHRQAGPECFGAPLRKVARRGAAEGPPDFAASQARVSGGDGGDVSTSAQKLSREREMTYILHHGAAEYVNEVPRQRKATRLEVAWAEWNGQRFEARTSSSAIMKLARVLVAAGAPDGPWRSLTAPDLRGNGGGTPSMSGPSLHRLGRLTISESDRGTVKIVPFMERADFGLPSMKKPAEGSEGYSDTPEGLDRPGSVGPERKACRIPAASAPPLPEAA